jgi:intracellular multiplication protein IcmL
MMAEEEQVAQLAEEEQIVQLQDNFYRDSFGKLLVILSTSCVAIVMLIATSIYFVLNKPAPVTFSVAEDWRVVDSVPVNQPYLSTADMLQWVSNVLPNAFIYDFLDYNEQLKNASQNFTTDGWKVFLNQLNNYVNYNKVQLDRLFVNAKPDGAPFVLNQGIILGRYGWWVQMPISITYAGNIRTAEKKVVLQVLVVRVPTTNNLNGIGIDNIMVAKDPTNSAAGTG